MAELRDVLLTAAEEAGKLQLELDDVEKRVSNSENCLENTRQLLLHTLEKVDNLQIQNKNLQTRLINAGVLLKQALEILLVDENS